MTPAEMAAALRALGWTVRKETVWTKTGYWLGELTVIALVVTALRWLRPSVCP